MISGIFTELCDYHTINFRTFSWFPPHQKEILYLWAVKPPFTPISPLLQPSVTSKVLSVPVDLPVLDIPHKWNHIKCGLLHWYLSLGVMFSVEVEVDFIKWISLESTKFGIAICLAWCFHINRYKRYSTEIFTINPKCNVSLETI